MTSTYQTTGIIVKKQGFAENDLLITFLSPEYGLIRAIAPNAKKHQSKLRGKTELFVVNNFLVTKGRNLDRIREIETQESYSKLRQTIEKISVSQYLAELIVNLAMTQQPQRELYALFNEHLRRIEQLSVKDCLFPYIAQAVFHFLAVIGIAPEVYACVETQQNIVPNFEQKSWKVGFSFKNGGLITINSELNPIIIKNQLNAVELALLQSLGSKNLLPIHEIIPHMYSDSVIENSWIRVERILKDYIEFYLGHALKSAEIITDILIAF